MPDSPSSEAQRPLILIAEDDPNIREALAFVLRRERFPFIAAEDGVEALRLFREKRPALAFLDVMLPGMDGIKVCEAVKKDPSLAGIRIVFLTAMGQTVDFQRGYRAGADAYFSKPFSPAGLVQKVKNMLGIS